MADVATEVNDAGIPYYSQVTVQVPRQCGKTTLVLALAVHRAIMWGGPQRIAYTAQTGKDAREKLIQDHVPVIQASSVNAAVQKIYLGVGLESVNWKNGSRIYPLASTASAGHGKTIDLAFIDEARFDVDDSREAALSPAMLTRPESQLWIISTAGDMTSVFFRKKVEDGRNITAQGMDSGRAFFDWSASDEADIEDPAVWRRTIPALGYTQTEESIRNRLETAMAEDKENLFRQEYLCQWTTMEASIIPESKLARVLKDDVAPTGRLSFGIDVALDRSAGAIAVCDETGRVELIEARDGVNWIVDRAVDLHRKYKAPLVVDGYSPANSLVDRLEAGGIPVARYSLRDMTAACGTFYDAILDEAIQIRSSPHLEAALRAVVKKNLSSGWLWSRTSNKVDIAPVFAATLAYYHATNRRGPETQRSVIF